ncbi:MAG: AAA family ATPase [Acidobacteriota bacterium]
MSTERFPVLVWEDWSGAFTGRLVEAWHACGAVGRSPEDVLGQLRDLLRWSQGGPAELTPDLEDAELVVFSVPIRPEYEMESRRHPWPDSVTVRVPCVHGSLEDGGRLACLPTFGTEFSYHDESSLKELVNHTVQRSLQGSTPAELVPRLPPRRWSLHELVIRPRKQAERRAVRPEHPQVLEQVAELVGSRRFRRLYSTAWQRDDEVASLVERLEGRSNILLLGEPGCGKTTVLAEAVRRLGQKARSRERRVTPDFWFTGAGQLIAGMKYLGEWQERLEEVVKGLQSIDGVLCLDSLLEIVRVGGSNAGDGIAAFLKPWMEAGELRIVAEATPAELSACRRLLPGLAELFEVLELPTLDAERSQRLIREAGESLGQQRRLEIATEVPLLIHELFERFQPAATTAPRVAFLRSLIAPERRSSPADRVVSNDDVVKLYGDRSGLPEVLLRDDVPLPLAEVEETLRADVRGQDAAVETLARVVTTFKAGLNDPARPVGVLLLCGPTGVGKTQAARSLASFCFGSGDDTDRLIRLDMSEHATYGSAERLLSTPRGEPSDFVRRVRSQPFCVVLLDEIEKAHSEVFDLFLTVLDEGRLTDTWGRVTPFTSAILVMTSNLGARSGGSLGFSKTATDSAEKAVRDWFRPEFFNRLDQVVTFAPLSEETVRDVITKELTELQRREGLRRRELTLSWNDELVELLVERGFDRRYGARPLQRAIEEHVVGPLARWLLTHRQERGRTLELLVGESGDVEVS